MWNSKTTTLSVWSPKCVECRFFITMKLCYIVKFVYGIAFSTLEMWGRIVAIAYPWLWITRVCMHPHVTLDHACMFAYATHAWQASHTWIPTRWPVIHVGRMDNTFHTINYWLLWSWWIKAFILLTKGLGNPLVGWVRATCPQWVIKGSKPHQCCR